MITTAHAPRWLWPVALASLVLTCPALAQVGYQARYRRVEEPQLLKLQITDAALGVYSEGDFEETTYRNTGQTVRYDRFFAAPSLSLSLAGSIYHPNLVQFQFSGEGAYGWSEQRTDSLTTSTRREEWQYLGRFNGSMEFLPSKPLHGNLTGSYGRSYREFDFFTRATVDTLNYGSRVAYTQPGLTLAAQYQHTDEDVLDISAPSHTRQDLASFDARQDRTRGSSGFNYTYNQQTTAGTTTGVIAKDHTVSLTEAERFGPQDQVQLNSSASYDHRDSSLEPNDQLNASANVFVQHRPDLSSAYSLDYNRFTAADVTANSVAGSAAVSHRLYESLASSLSVAGADYESSGNSGSGYSRRYGGAWTEAYTKKLSADHRLRVDNSLAVEHVDEKSTGHVVNERHVFPSPPDTESFLLNLANVIELTIVVTDAAGVTLYTRGIDYQVFLRGTRTEIQRIPGGTIPAGGTVLVDYDAEPTPAGGYETYTDAFGVRVDLWRNFWGLYGRVRASRNNAEATLRVQEVTSYIAGTDFNWQWFRTGAEYAQYESTDTDYWTARLFESFTFKPDDTSSLGLNFLESFSRHQDAHREEQDYQGTARYRRALARNLLVNVDAGLDYRRGTSVDQTRAIFRPELRYVFGQTSVHFTYDYEYNLYLGNEERHKHQFTLTVKRDF